MHIHILSKTIKCFGATMPCTMYFC